MPSASALQTWTVPRRSRKSAGRWTAWREFVACNSIWATASWPLPPMILSCSRRWTRSARQASSRNLLAIPGRRLLPLRLPRQRASGRPGASRWAPWGSPWRPKAWHSPSQTACHQGAGNGTGCGGHRAVGFLGLRQGLAALRQGRLNINALDDRGRDRRFSDRPVARSGDGDGLVCHCGSHRGARRGSARGAIKSLPALVPEQAEVRQDDGSWARSASRKSLWARRCVFAPASASSGWHRSLGQSAIDHFVTGEQPAGTRALAMKSSPAPSNQLRRWKLCYGACFRQHAGAHHPRR